LTIKYDKTTANMGLAAMLADLQILILVMLSAAVPAGLLLLSFCTYLQQ
jgi:hypothetical protein